MEEQFLGGRYRLVSTLGRGGMATVWRAVDELLDREVAVKVLDLTGPDSEKSAERFRVEARTTAALNHPNIVTVYDTGVDGNSAYIVMELLPGPTLAEAIISQGELPIHEIRSIGKQVSLGLSAAHAAGMVHRDIKPGNIAYAGPDVVKVLDFGITQFLDETSMTQAQTVVGTAEYLAPEQATGGRAETRSDLYALGCVMTALLTGRPPFVSDSPTTVLLKHLHEPPPDLLLARPDCPPGLAKIVSQLLAKEAADRPATAADVAQMLTALAREETTQVLQTQSETSVLQLPPLDPEPGSPTAAPAVAPVASPTETPTAPAASGAPETSDVTSSPAPVEPPAAPAATPSPAESAQPEPARDATESSPDGAPPATRAESRKARRRSRTGIPWQAWAVLGVVVTGGLLIWLGGRDASLGTSGSPPTVTQTASTVTETTLQTTTSSTSTTTTPTTAATPSTPKEALAAMRRAVLRERSQGAVDGRAATVLGRVLNDIGKALADDSSGTSPTAMKKVEELGLAITEMADSGHITAAGVDALAGPFGDLQRLVSGAATSPTSSAGSNN